MYELHREIGRGCIFLSPLFLPLFLLFKLNFKTSSTSTFFSFWSSNPFPFLSQSFRSRFHSWRRSRIDRNEFSISRIQITRFTEFPRVLSFIRARNVRARCNWKMSVSRFCVSVHWEGASLSSLPSEFRVLSVPSYRFFLIVMIDGDEFFSLAPFLLKSRKNNRTYANISDGNFNFRYLDDTSSSGKSLASR